MQLDITIIIVIITVLISISGFSNQKIIDDLIFYPPAVSQRNQWYRFISCGLIHADAAHLGLEDGVAGVARGEPQHIARVESGLAVLADVPFRSDEHRGVEELDPVQFW